MRQRQRRRRRPGHDGATVDLPKREYSGAVLWNGKLVASRYDGEAFYPADVIAT